mgnify:CR=1 FL=1
MTICGIVARPKDQHVALEALRLVRIPGDQDGGAVKPVEERGGAVGVESHGRSIWHPRTGVIRDAP